MDGVEEFWAYWRNNICIKMIRLAVGGGGKSWVNVGDIHETEFQMDAEVTEFEYRLKKNECMTFISRNCQVQLKAALCKLRASKYQKHRQ
jgi:hypothetical protein